MNHDQPTIASSRREPPWPAILNAFAIGAIFLAMPEPLSFGPRWLLLLIVCALTIPSAIAHHTGRQQTHIALGHTISSVITVFMLWSLGLLVAALAAHALPPIDLLRSAALLWLTNVLTFASWYWRLDAGGPHVRATRSGHPTGAFLFPQMSADAHHRREADGTPWSPRFADYLFLAFNTSTALSPTDAPVLSRWAKGLMMLQATISLMVIVILVGRAINIM